MSLFKGTGVALITPFSENGVDESGLKKTLDHVIKGGVDFVVVLGTTGEPSCMSSAEKEQVITTTISHVNKRVPVVVGTGGNNTQLCVEASKNAQSLGADGLLVVTPYYNKCTQNGAVAHYKAISDAVNVPIIAYNVPSRTGFNMLPAAVSKLHEAKNLVAIKEASGDVLQMMETARLIKGKLDLLSGDDLLTLPSMSFGGVGVISVAANTVPHLMKAVTDACFKGDFKSATDTMFKIAPLYKALFCEVNPIPVKKSMELLGLCSGRVRMPLTEMESVNAENLKAVMQELKII